MGTPPNNVASANKGLVSEEDLVWWSGYTQRAAIERWLRKRNIPFTDGKDGRICTALIFITRFLENKSNTEVDFA